MTSLQTEETLVNISKRYNFKSVVKKHGLTLDRKQLKTVQINVGKLCNQACLHCHVEAGPKRKEIMKENVALRIIELLKNSSGIETFDITGGAPELCPSFRLLAKSAYDMGLHVIDRCNLTVLYEEGQEDLAQFLKDHSIHVIASLPCYTKDNVEKQRGGGVFKKSIDGLLQLNRLGYGKPDSGLFLDLVYNPLGASLPPAQDKLQADYKKELRELFGIEFNNLFAITNVPIKRFLHQLENEGKYEDYMNLLVSSFNPEAAKGIMCRDLISVGWRGELSDCDFNQMLDIPAARIPRTIWDIESFNELAEDKIAFASHCFACTAGAGSSCQGIITSD